MAYNKVNGKTYDVVDENSISFSADSRMIAYSAKMGKMQFNVIDGREGSQFNKVGFPLMSLTGKRIAYWAKDSINSFVIIDNVKSQPYDEVTSIIFSSDDKHCTYIATRNRKQLEPFFAA